MIWIVHAQVAGRKMTRELPWVEVLEELMLSLGREKEH